MPGPMNPTGSMCLLTAATSAAALLSSAAGALRCPGDDEPGDSLASVVESELELPGPGDLPGREPGPRVRPTTQPSEPTQEQILRDWFGEKPYWEWSRATGDWGGLRTDLEKLGLTFAGSYTFEWSSVWAGGERNRASSRSLLDLNLTVDTFAAFDFTGGTFFVDFQSSDMRGAGDAGSFMSTSGIDTGDNIDQVSEVWYQQIFSDGLVRVKAGKIDAGLEFAYVTAGENFTHSSNTFLYTNDLVPTYPDPAMGACAFVYPDEHVYIGAGFFDGSLNEGVHTGRLGPKPLFDGDDYLWIAEAGLTWNAFGALAGGRLAAGGWVHTGEFVDAGGDPVDGAGAGYVLFEQRLLPRERAGADAKSDSKAGLVAFLFAGFADSDVRDAQTQITGGLTLNGTFEGRDDDAAGLLVTWLDLSNDRGFARNETAFELMYKFQLTPFASVKPAIQYIVNPGGDSQTDDAVVGVLQLELDF